MILIISGPPGAGKTCLLTFIACMYAFDRRRNRQMQLEILNKQANGFSELATIPEHTVSANYDIRLKKFGYTAPIKTYQSVSDWVSQPRRQDAFQYTI